MFKTADLRDIVYTTLLDDIKENFDEKFLFVSVFVSDAKPK